MRPRQLRGVVFVVASTLLFCPSAARSAELKVEPSAERPGTYVVQKGNGRRAVFSVALREPTQVSRHQSSGDCRWSNWPGHEVFELVVAHEPVWSPIDVALVPLSHPMNIVELHAVEGESALLVAVKLEYACVGRFRDYRVETWVVVEIEPRVRLLRNSILIEGARCSRNDSRVPRA